MHVYTHTMHIVCVSVACHTHSSAMRCISGVCSHTFMNGSSLDSMSTSMVPQDHIHASTYANHILSPSRYIANIQLCHRQPCNICTSHLYSRCCPRIGMTQALHWDPCDHAIFQCDIRLLGFEPFRALLGRLDHHNQWICSGASIDLHAVLP